MRRHGLALALFLSGCGVAVEDRTATTLPRNPAGLYDVTVRVERASSIVNVTGVEAQTSYGNFPMVPAGSDEWRVQLPIAPCVNGFDLRYAAKWQAYLAGNTVREPRQGVQQKWLTGPLPQGCTSQFGRLFTVNSSADLPDANPGDGLCRAAGTDNSCTLRAAVMEANALRGQDRIELGSATYVLSRSGNDDSAQNGDLDLLDEVAIVGDGAVISAGETNDRVFDVAPIGAAIDVELRGITIRQGRAQIGAGIRSKGRLQLASVTVRDNIASGAGAGIANLESFLELTGSEVRDNRINGEPAAQGAGIYSTGAGLVVIQGSSIIGNDSSQHGGGIMLLDGQLLMRDSTVADNKAGVYGAGLFFNPQARGTLRNVTITGNRADADNSGGGDGGGIKHGAGAGQVTVANSIIAGNLGPHPRDCAGTLDSRGYNLIGSGDGCAGLSDADIKGTQAAPRDPGLGPLTGFPRHQVPNLTSAARDAGHPNEPNDARTEYCTHTDQRGIARPQGPITEGRARCDMGAVERQ